MALSASVDYNDTTNQLITDALRDISVLQDGQSASPSMLVDGKRRLNRLIKAWQAETIGIWLKQEITLALAYQTQYYDLGPTGTHATTSMVATAIASDASSGASTITVDDDDGISNGDYIGVELDDGTMQWTTVNGTPAANVITLTAVLTDDAAEDNVVYAYTTKTHRPLRLVRDTVRLVDSSGNETAVKEVSNQEYKILTDKTTLGKANQVFYDPQLTNGRLYVWPTCDNVSDRLKFDIERPIYDCDDLTNEVDIPQYYLLALEYNLAMLLAPSHNVPDNVFVRISALATNYYIQARDFDRENVSLFFQPDL